MCVPTGPRSAQEILTTHPPQPHSNSFIKTSEKTEYLPQICQNAAMIRCPSTATCHRAHTPLSPNHAKIHPQTFPPNPIPQTKHPARRTPILTHHTDSFALPAPCLPQYQSAATRAATHQSATHQTPVPAALSPE